MKHLILFLLSSATLWGVTPQDIPTELWDDYTLSGRIPVLYWYLDSTSSSDTPIIFKIDEVKNLIKHAKNKTTLYYGETDNYLYKAIETYVGNFDGRSVGVLGTVIPWYESIILAYGGKPVTIEYNKIISLYPDIQVMTVDEFKQNPIKFDYLLSISSIEHDGLGRYGDPLNPFGDLETMSKCFDMLKEGGLFFLAIPVGPDQVVWNAHRIYGKIRLPMVLKDWKVVDKIGFSAKDFDRQLNNWEHQPVFVLTKGDSNAS